MPNNKVHSRTKLQGKKGSGASKTLHPHSRRAKQITRVSLREEKLASKQKNRIKASQSKTNALLWFAFALDPGCQCLSADQVHELIATFLARHDEAIAEEEQERRPGRPKSKNLEALEEERDRETREYESGGGLLIPDLTHEIGVHNLRHWLDHLDGTSTFLPKLRLVRAYKNKELVLEQTGAEEKIYGGKKGELPKADKQDEMEVEEEES